LKASRSILRAAVVVLVLNGLFLLLVVLAVPDEPSATRARVRAAFKTSDLAHEDYLLFDSRRGFFQYNDCNVLQMIANAGSSRLERAISPVVYSANGDWTDQCAVLDRAIAQDRAVDGLIENRYSRYWHGYNAGVATALRWMELRTLRRTLVAAVWLSLATLTLLMFRSGAGSRRIGGGIALAAGAFWAVPYFDPGFTFGFGDAALLLGGVEAPEGWVGACREAFLDGYLALADERLLPASRTGFDRLLGLYELEKLVYELRYETRNRPEWATIPIVGMLRVLEPVS